MLLGSVVSHVCFFSCLLLTRSLRSSTKGSAQRFALRSVSGADDAAADELSIESVKLRMQYWSEQKPDVPPTNPATYLVFDPDIGGLNNIRIAWEAAGLIAGISGRTLVLPPPKAWYLLDQQGMTSRVEDFVNLDQLKHGLSALTFDEFVNAERTELDRRSFGTMVPSYQGGGSGPDYSQWARFANKNLDMINGEVCKVDNYRNQDQKFLYVPADASHRIFGCSKWWEMGQPRFKESDGSDLPIPAWGYKLLKDNFVWHPKFWSMSSPIVQELGLFKYYALHARFGDFQFHEFQQPFDGVASAMQKIVDVDHGSSPTFLQTKTLSTQQMHVRAKARGEMLVRRVSSLLPPDATVYISTDERSPSLLEAFTQRGIKALRWDEVLSQGEHGPLGAAFALVGGDMQLLKKLSGPIEQLICSYSRVFVGTSRSTFTSYIQRLRIYNGAPAWHTPLYHTKPLTAAENDMLQKELAVWDQTGGSFDVDSSASVFPPATAATEVSESLLEERKARDTSAEIPPSNTEGGNEVDLMRRMLERH